MDEVNNNYYVYALLDTRKPGTYTYGENKEYSFNYEPFYIGKGKKGRAYQHFKLKPRDKSGNPHKFNKIQRIIEDTSCLPIVCFIKLSLREKDALSVEENAIKVIGKIKDKNGPLTNITDGGEKYFSMWRYKDVREKFGKKVSGEGNPNVFFKESQIEEIIQLMSEGWTNKQLSKKYNFRSDYFYEFRSGTYWPQKISQNLGLFEKSKNYKHVNFSLTPPEIESLLKDSLNGIPRKELRIKYNITRYLVNRILTNSAAYTKKLSLYHDRISVLYKQLKETICHL